VHPRFDIIYLYNSNNVPLPDVEIYTKYGDGINISANHITEEVIANCKRNHKKIGVWIRSADFEENEEFYQRMFSWGVDFICADKPLEAMATRSRYFKTKSL
jgi:glycerophosphoryl diester phosphodiesterase